ncbi:hypothetical protein FE391_43345 [Nonomuraea sp. KC401]|uniref:hypothetical protein n=1 Tax=Nonomuraea sp. KC401 TaxID=1848324 RepID=UPI0010FD845B|nr:hypothetical protein [Nonomuraea sp. KC401]TLF52695.1 hypothetical protein FE391_43345 [Nonomuraea sp. KC401]
MGEVVINASPRPHGKDRNEIIVRGDHVQEGRQVGSPDPSRLSAAMTAVVAMPGAALAAPPTPHFGPEIEGYAPHQYQTTCDPAAKPGVLDFRDLLNRTYGTHISGISRDCNSGGTSEHKEGRALDYHFNVSNPTQNAHANDLLNWLLATDQYGNRNAMVRRLGIMYIIWNRRIWQDGSWAPYNGASPHTDHIHFSFGWPGARRETSWWHPSGPRVGRVFWNMRSPSGAWTGARVSDQGPVGSVAYAGGPDGSLHQFTLAGGRVHLNTRRADGSWTGARITDQGPVSAVAAAAGPDGEVYQLTLAGGRVHLNVRVARRTECPLATHRPV